MSEPSAQPAKHVGVPGAIVSVKADRRFYIGWSIAFGLLVLLGAFCWLVLKPCQEVRSAIRACHARERFWLMPLESDVVCWRRATAREQVARLGGPQTAFRALRLYLHLPDRFAPDKGTARALLAECGKQAVPELLRVIERTNDDTWLTAGILAETVDENCTEAIGPFISLLRGGAHHEADEAARGLRRIGRPAVQPLIAALRDPDAVRRMFAAGILGEIGDQQAVAPLIEALKDSVPDVRRGAAMALGELKDSRAARPLEDLLLDDDVHVRLEATEALKKIRGE